MRTNSGYFNGRPMIVALTGGIASGKSVASDHFSSLGVPIIDTDLVAREAVRAGSIGLRKIVDTFGPGVLDQQGALDRRCLREIVFTDDHAREQLNSILHPIILQKTASLIENVEAPYCIVVIPLLADLTNAPAYIDRTLVIDVTASMQQTRLQARDGLAQRDAQRMIDAQASREARLAIADDVIVNDGTVEDLKLKLDGLHERYTQIATSFSGTPASHESSEK